MSLHFLASFNRTPHLCVITQEHVNGNLWERPVHVSWQEQTPATWLYVWVKLSWVSVQTGLSQTPHLQLPFPEATCSILMVVKTFFPSFFSFPPAEEDCRTVIHLR